MIPSTTVLWPVHNPVLFKQACIYTTEDTIVCDEICIHTNKLQHGFFLDILVANCSAECRVSSGSEIRTRDLRFQGEDDTTTQKGLTRKCGRITSVTTDAPLKCKLSRDLHGRMLSGSYSWLRSYSQFYERKECTRGKKLLKRSRRFLFSH